MSAPHTIQSFEVDATRLASGTWCHTTDKLVGEGDISASYSADKIGMEGRVRRPFKWMNALWVCTSMTSHGDTQSAEAYRLVHLKHFAGEIKSYNQAVAVSTTARDRPEGFYHGMTVSHGGSDWVLCGPHAVFTPSKVEQLALF